MCRLPHKCHLAIFKLSGGRGMLASDLSSAGPCTIIVSTARGTPKLLPAITGGLDKTPRRVDPSGGRSVSGFKGHTMGTGAPRQ